MEAHPTISVIIPIYKVEKYLRKCLDSVIHQSVTPYEVILVNDGSPDRSDKICKDYATRYSFFKYIEQDNQGVSAARNNGMSRATGDYITFLDPDDTYALNAIEEMQRLIMSQDADLYHFANLEVDEGDNTPYIRCNQPYQHNIKLYTVADLDKERYLRGWASWLYLFHRSLLKNLDHQFTRTMSISEDQVFLLTLLPHCKTIAVLDKPLVYYLHRKGSATNSAPTHKKADSYLQGSKLIMEAWKGQGSDMPKYVSKYGISYLLRHYYKAHFKLPDITPKEERTVMKEVRGVLRQAKRYHLKVYQSHKIKLISYLYPFLRSYYRKR